MWLKLGTSAEGSHEPRAGNKHRGTQMQTPHATRPRFSILLRSGGFARSLLQEIHTQAAQPSQTEGFCLFLFSSQGQVGSLVASGHPAVVELLSRLRVSAAVGGNGSETRTRDLCDRPGGLASFRSAAPLLKAVQLAWSGAALQAGNAACLERKPIALTRRVTLRCVEVGFLRHAVLLNLREPARSEEQETTPPLH
ncbi:hypothetical protein AOLI_G00103500 [Acnodon oligacanthus]